MRYRTFPLILIVIQVMDSPTSAEREKIRLGCASLSSFASHKVGDSCSDQLLLLEPHKETRASMVRPLSPFTPREALWYKELLHPLLWDSRNGVLSNRKFFLVPLFTTSTWEALQRKIILWRSEERRVGKEC